MKARMNIALMCLYMLIGALEAKAQANLSIKDFVMMPGETKQVYIDMDNTVEIRALQVLVTMPNGVKLAARPTVVSKRVGGYVDADGHTIEAAKSLRYKVREDGSCMIVVNADDAVPFSGKEGAVIALTMKAGEDMKELSGEITLKDMELVYADGVTSVRPEDTACRVDVCSGATSIAQWLKDKAGCCVDVYDLNGALLKRGIAVEQLRVELATGIYVIEGVKVYVK